MRRLLAGCWVWCVACGTDGAADPVDTGALATEPVSGPLFAEASEDGAVVAAVDPARYVGLWYEIATTGSFQQQSCAGTTATYTPIDAVTLEVYNRCSLGGLDGPVSEIVGTATALDDSFARLEVDFGFGFAAPYDIVELDGSTGDAPYAFAAVSSFSGAQVWVLSRSPEMDAETYASLVARLDGRGFDASGRLVPTEHPPAE